MFPALPSGEVVNAKNTMQSFAFVPTDATTVNDEGEVRSSGKVDDAASAAASSSNKARARLQPQPSTPLYEDDAHVVPDTTTFEAFHSDIANDCSQIHP